jgi:hypothetical protein
VTGHPLFVVLGLAAAGGQDSAPAARLHVSYRAVATLDESARVLRGTVQVRIFLAAGDALGSLALDTGRTHLGAVTGEGIAPGPRGEDGHGLRVPLRTPLIPGDSVEIAAEFTAPAAPPAVHSASDRHFDFREWLPAVLEPGGEPRGPAGTFLVTLDVLEDQVVGATGVPLCGDPGWARARRPAGRPVTLARNAYSRLGAGGVDSLPSDACAPVERGRKRIVWYAEDVRDVALTMDPDFRYEEGDYLQRPVRVLYLPGDERAWGAGVAAHRTETALAWLHEVFDAPKPADSPWPQTTLVHGSDHGGSADPMVVAVAAPDQQTILQAVGRRYVSGAVAVAPADNAWLDDGLVWFVSDLYFETQGRRSTYRRLERAVLDEELDGRTQPVLPERRPGAGLDSAAARRSEFLLYQLRAAAGDATISRILHAYWARARLRSADESLFVATADAAGAGDLGGRFAAALRDAAPVDYAVGAARRAPLPGGRWRTTVEVRRLGGGQFPFEVRVLADSDTVAARAGGVAQRETVTVETATRPRRVVLDEAGTSHDWNVLNNQRTFGFRLGRSEPTADFLDPYFARPSRRDRLARSWAPVAWYNDAGGWTVGVRRRDDYLGRFDLNELWAVVRTGVRATDPLRGLDGDLAFRNPTWLRSPGLSQRLELARIEGRSIAALGVERAWRHAAAGVSLAWIGATTSAYLDSALYERAGTLELTAESRGRWDGPDTRVRIDAALAGGHASWRAAAPTRASGGSYARGTAVAVVDRALGALHLRARVSGGAALARGHVVRQRRIFLAGADPYELLTSPFQRTRGALLVRDGIHYHAPGGAALRGFSPELSARQAYGLSLELERGLARRSGGLANRLAVAAFGDGAMADGDLDPDGRLVGAADAGIGVRIDHRIGATSFQTRFDFPLWVSRPLLAQDTGPGGRRLGFRWIFSFAPAF